MSLTREMFENGMSYQDIAEDFETENAKLRQQLADVTESMGRMEKLCAKLRALAHIGDLAAEECSDLAGRLTDLQAENAKLRELLTFYLGCLTKGHVNCDSCAFKDNVCGHGRKVIDGARKLGIEVK